MYPTEAAPPRPLPLHDKLCLLLGGFFSFFGWAFYGFGMIFAFVFVGNSEAVHLLEWGNWESTQGTISWESRTNSSENGQAIMRYDYTYVAAGDSLRGRAYLPGGGMEVGASVAVEYQTDEPQVSRIPGARRKAFGYWVLVVLLFPLVGLGFILFSLRKNFKAIDLIVNGQFARGKLIKREPTHTKINEQMVYKYTFSFVAPEDGNPYEVVAKTHLRHTLEDEETERLLYARVDPAHAVMYDSISGAPAILPDGNLEAVFPKKWMVLIVPGLTVLLHLGYAYFRWV